MGCCSLMNSTCVCHLNEVQLMCTHTAHMHAVSLTGQQWWMKGSNVFSTSIYFFNSNILKLQLQLGSIPICGTEDLIFTLANFWIIHRGLNIEARCVLVAWRMVMSTCWGNCRNTWLQVSCHGPSCPRKTKCIHLLSAKLGLFSLEFNSARILSCL